MVEGDDDDDDDDDGGGGGGGQRGEEVRTTRALRNDGGREAEKKIWAGARRQGRKGHGSAIRETRG